MTLGMASESLAVFFLLIGLSIGGVCRELNKRFKLPYTPMLFVIGIFLGFYKESFGLLGKQIAKISNINPHGVLMIFLPPLIFQSGFNSDWHIFRKQSKQIFILAFPALAVSAILITFSLKVLLNYDDKYYTWVGAFMFGSILSCTDTVAVLALLKEVGAPKKLNSLIQGESLLNDGAGMILFTISAEIMKGNELSLKETVLLFLSLTVGGIVLGLVFGYFAASMINRVRNDPILTLNISFVSCYILYFIAQNVDFGFKISGIMSLVSMGLYMAAFGKTKISAEAKQTVHEFWKYIIYAAETTIFLIAGILVGVNVLASQQSYQLINILDFYNLIGLYVSMLFARFISIAVFMPTLKSSGYGLTWRQVYVLSYGGLRGAVGIAFSLIISSNPQFPQKFRTIVLFDMAGCAFLTLVINAPTSGYIIKKLGLCVKSEVKEKIFLNFMEALKGDMVEKVDLLKKNKYLANSVWENVEELASLNDLQQQIDNFKAKRISKQETKLLQMSRVITVRNQSIFSESSNELVDQQMIMQCRNRFLLALKGIYWQKFQNHQCSSQSVILLTEGVDWDLDTLQDPMNSWDYLESHLQNPLFIAICFRLKNVPIVGNYAFSALFNKISFIYDVLSTYIQALQQCENESKMMRIQQPVISQVIKESEDNRVLAAQYLDYYIRISFPEITQKIQMIKASQSILTYQKLILYNHFHHGQIDEKEYQQIKNIFDLRIKQLDEIGNNWRQKEKNILSYLNQNDFFKLLDEPSLKSLVAHSNQLLFEKDQFIIKQEQKARYFFLITRGQISQQSSKALRTYKEKLGVNSLIGIYNVLSINLRYHTSVCARSITCVISFPLPQIIELVKSNKILQGYLYKECMPLLSSIFSQLNCLTNFHFDIFKAIKQKGIFKLMKSRQILDHNHLEILVSGKVKFMGKQILAPALLQGQKGSIIAMTKSKLFIFEQNITIQQKPIEIEKHQRLQSSKSIRQTYRATNNYFIPSQSKVNNSKFFYRAQQQV